MKNRKIKLYSILFVFIFIFSIAGLVQAIAPPPDPEPPPINYLYRIYGYVKSSTTGAPVSGATVKYYKNGVTYIGYSTTSSTGYFSKSYRSIDQVSKFKAAITRSGYYSTYKIASVVGETCYFRTIYMTPITPLPDDPIIYGVSHQVGQSTVTVEWSMDFDSVATSNSMQFLWNDGSQWVTKQSWPAPTDGYYSYMVTGLEPDYYEYKIEASSANAAGTSSSSYGPVEVNYHAVPYAPSISNVGHWLENWEGTLVFDVDWGQGTTSYLVQAYWDAIDYFDDNSIVYTSSSGLTHYSVATPKAHYGTYLYKIVATGINEYGESSTTYGPIEQNYYLYPSDDTFTDSGTEIANYGTLSNMYVTYYHDGNHPERTYGWLKFQLDDHQVIEQALLYAYVVSLPEVSHGSISVYEAGTGWTETSLTWSNQGSAISSALDTDTSGSAGSWDVWDITDLARAKPEFALLMKCTTSDAGARYYTTEYADPTYRIHLKLKYFGVPERQIKDFRNDHFAVDTYDPVTNTLDPSWEINPAPGGYLQGGFEFNYEGTGFDEGTNLYFPDVYRTVHDSWKGHYFDQTGLSLNGGFMFETKLGWYMDWFYAPYFKMGIQLLSSNGGVVAELYYDFPGSWGDIALIKARSGDYQGYYGTALDPGSTTMPHDALFQIYRDPYVREITFTYYEVYAGGVGANPHTVLTAQNSGTVETVRLFVTASTQGAPPDWDYYSFSAWFDFVKSSKVLDLRNPGPTIAPFTEPIIDASFEESTISGWTSEDGGAPVGIPGYSGLDSDHNWIAYTSESTWSMKQELDGSRNEFRLDAIRSKRISFSYHAMFLYAIGHDVRLRAMIRCWENNNNEPIVIAGDWVTVAYPDDGSNDWVEVPVRTMYPLPYSIQRIEVVMIGESINPTESFGVYIDAAKLNILDDESFSGVQNFTPAGAGSECGISYISTIVSYCAIEGDEYVIRVAQLMIAVANTYHTIHHFQFEFELLPLYAGSSGSVTVVENGIFEFNDQGISGPDPTPEQQAGRELAAKIALAATTGIFFLLFGITFPVSTVGGFFINNLLGFLLLPSLIPDTRVFIDVSASGSEGSVYLDYEYTSVTIALASVVLEWRCPLSGFAGVPALRLDFTTGWYFLNAMNSMILTFSAGF